MINATKGSKSASARIFRKRKTDMRDDVAAIIEHESTQHAELPVLVAALPDELALWELMDSYNWDDGFTVPLAVASHLSCDRALALRMFWELDDSARIHYEDESSALSEVYETKAEFDPEGFRVLADYCSTLVKGLREGSYPSGRNRFDTGYFNLEDPALSERQRAIRAAHTKLAQKEFEEAFLHPVL